jgi:hypothetical protein
MPLTYQFSDAGHLVTLTVTDPWTAQELEKFYEAERPYFDKAGNYKVHTLVDIRKMRSIPPGVLSRRKSPNITHKNSGLVLLVGASHLAQIMVNTAFTLTHVNKARFFSDISEAEQFLEQAMSAEQASHPSRGPANTPPARPTLNQS